MSVENQVQLIGHLGQNPKIVKTQSEVTIANFSLATNYNYKNDKGEKQTITTWLNCVAFGKRAALVANYLVKGSHVLIQGKLQNREYISKTGEKHISTEILIDNVLFLDQNPK